MNDNDESHIGTSQDMLRLLTPPVIAKAWVVYLDILGYKKMIAEATNREGLARHVARLRRVLYNLKKDAALARECEVIESLRVFSDAIFIVVRKRAEAADITWVADMVHVVCELVGNLATEGIFVRGAAVYGEHYDEEDLVVSPALIRAYDMEQEEALYPRVLVDTAVRDMYLAWVDVASSLGMEGYDADRERDKLWQDRDGRCFINYLALYRTRREAGDPPLGKYFLLQHKARVEEAMSRYARDPRIAAKYEWLASYHNAYCRHLGATKLLSPDEFLVQCCAELVLSWQNQR